MEAEIFTIILESLSGVAVLGLGFWFVIARLRNHRIPDDPTEKYVTKSVFHEAIREGRELAVQRHEAELKAIQAVGTEFRTAINQTDQNHLDHVQHGHDD